MNDYTYLCNRLLLIKICSCCLLDIHLYSNSLRTTATIFLINRCKLSPASFSCDNNFNLSQISSGFSERIVIFEKDFFETLEAEIIKSCDLGKFITVLSQVDLIPRAITSK